MAIEFNPNLNSMLSQNPSINKAESVQPTEHKVDFGKAISNSFNNVNKLHSDANTSIVDLLSGKNQDVNSVVASVARADMSFKLLVGVRNKLVEAYKETMKMQV